MTEMPTIEARKQKRIALMTTDAEFIAGVRTCLPADWTLVEAASLDAYGGWHEILLFRFLLLDLDEVEQFDPLDVIHVVRREYQINLPVFCFGGDQDIQDEMRLARADRFFDRADMLQRLPDFVRQYDW